MHPNEQGPIVIRQSAPEPVVVEDDEIDLRELFGILLDGKWLIAAIAAVCLVFGAGYAFLSTPIYRADALLQVEQQSANPLSALEDIPGLMGAKSPADTEIQILRSRAVVGQAVDRLHLTVSAEPKRFPLIGGFIARHYEGDGPAEPWFWFDSYGWGGERIRVPRFLVPDSLQGEEFTLIAGGRGEYRVLDPEGAEILSGKAGEEALSADGRYGVFVAELLARPGTEFTLIRYAWLEAVENLLEELGFGESGKSTGIIRASVKHTDPRRAETILQGIAGIYLRQNVERRSAQAEESLRFLEQQLPELRQQLETAEEQMNAYRQQRRAVDLGAEAESVLKQMVEIESQLAQIELSRAELSKRFKPDHPRMQALNEQRAELQGIRARLEKQIEGLPQTQQEVLRLSRQVEVNTQLYTALLNKSQELRVIKAGTVGNVRILDSAVAGIKPVAPRKALSLVLSMLLGTTLGVVAVFLRHSLRRSIGDPDEIERKLGLPVYAAVPFTAHQRQYERRERRKESGRLPLLAAEYPQDPAVESLRSFRTSLHFGMLGAKSNRIVITGPAPGIGKSFLSANSAYLLGEGGKKVLLIDADMRRSRLHEHIGHERAPGLSEVLVGQAEWQAVIHPLSERCDVLTSGTLPPNPSELLMSGALDRLLEQVSERYDYVLIDTPPVLAVTDAGLIAAKCDATFLVARAGKTELGELELAMKRLRQTRAVVSGVAINALSREMKRDYGKYRYYQYEYRSDT